MPIPARYHEPLLTPHAARNIEAAWTFAAPRDGSAVVLPDGRCDVILRFNAYDTAPPVPVVTGPATQPYTITYTRGDTWVGLRLRPGFGAAIWGDGVARAKDTVLRGPDAVSALPDLGALHAVPREADALQSALMSLPCILDAQPNPSHLQAALDGLHVSGGRLSITNLAQLVACSPRHLGRLFHHHLGLSPKTYAGLVRFHRAVALLNGCQLSLPHIALEAGFADQAHMTRTLRRFGGFAPTQRPNQISQPGFFA